MRTVDVLDVLLVTIATKMRQQLVNSVATVIPP